MSTNRCKYRRRADGGMLAEATAALSLLFPILVLVIFVTLEASEAYVIARHMNNAAFLAARALAVKYQAYPMIKTDSAAQQQIFNTIRIPNMVSGNMQFGSPVWSTNQTPDTVTVSCRYLSGQGNPPLPTFPRWNPLNLGPGFQVASSATYRLQ